MDKMYPSNPARSWSLDNASDLITEIRRNGILFEGYLRMVPLTEMASNGYGYISVPLHIVALNKKSSLNPTFAGITVCGSESTIDLNNPTSRIVLELIMNFSDTYYNFNDDAAFEVAWLSYWMLNRSIRTKLSLSLRNYEGIQWNVKSWVNEFMKSVKTEYGMKFLNAMANGINDSYKEFALSSSVAQVFDSESERIMFCITPEAHEVLVKLPWHEEVITYRKYIWENFIAPLIEVIANENDTGRKVVNTLNVYRYLKLVPTGRVENAFTTLHQLAEESDVARRVCEINDIARIACRMSILCSFMSSPNKTVKIAPYDKVYDTAGNPTSTGTSMRIGVDVMTNDDEAEFFAATAVDSEEELEFTSNAEAWRALDGIMTETTEMAKVITADIRPQQEAIEKLSKNSVQRFLLENYYLNSKNFKGMIWA